MPSRLRLSRAKGYRLPPGAIKVDRSTRWGNPFVVGVHGDRGYCVTLFRYLLGGFINVCAKGGAEHIEQQKATRRQIADHLSDLRGHDLACWCGLCPAHKDGLPFGVSCPDCAPCHAAVLLELANG